MQKMSKQFYLFLILVQMWVASSESGSLLSLYLRSDTRNNCFPVQNIDPNLEYKIPCGLPRYFDAVIHWIRLDIAFNRKYLHNIEQSDSPLCQDCAMPESIEHPCHCNRYHSQRRAKSSSCILA